MNKKLVNILFWVVLATATVAGLVGIGMRVAGGLRTTNLGSTIPWGLWLALYIYFIGLSAGAFLISSLVYVFGVERFRPVGRLALFTALCCLITAVLFVWIDLGHMERFWRLFLHPDFQSLLTWVIWLYAFYFLLLSAELWLEMRQDLIRWKSQPGIKGTLGRILSLGAKDLSPESRTKDLRTVKILGSIGVPLAIMFHGGVGAVFGVTAARPAWNSGLYPIIFLASALASGGALLTFIYAFFSPDRGSEAHRSLVVTLGQITLGLVLLDALFTFSEFLIALYGAVPGHSSPLLKMMTGPFWYVFWIFQVGLGVVVPVVLIGLVRSTRRSVFWIGVACAAVVLGFVGVRLNIVIPPLSVPELSAIPEAFPDPRIQPTYFPSGVEWLSSVGVVSLGVLIFALGLSLLPIKTSETSEVLETSEV